MLLWLVLPVISVASLGNRQWLTKVLNDDYDNTEPPNGTRGPTRVSIDFYVESLGNFQIGSMDYSLDMYFVERWNDHRLTHNQGECRRFIEWSEVTKFWRPDVYLANAKTADFNKVTLPNQVMQICPDGGIRYSVRIAATVSCNMNLKSYPFDRQTCNLRIMNYGNNASYVHLDWVTSDAIRVNPNILEADLQLDRAVPTYCDGSFVEGNYSCLLAEFHLNRELSQYVIQVYLPTSSIVIISWISFWIDPLSVPGRVGLCVTTLLTLATQASGFSHQLPKTGYTKALDLWMSVCLMFLFGALIEFAIVNTCMRQTVPPSTEKPCSPTCVLTDNGRRSSEGLTRLRRKTNETEGAPLCDEIPVSSVQRSTPHSDEYYRRLARNIDRYCFIAFPSTFGLFVFAYFWTFTGEYWI